MIRAESEKMLMAGKPFFEPVTFAGASTLPLMWEVPAGVKKVHVDCVANQGGNSGGKGGRVECDLEVTPKQMIYVVTGKVPGNIETAVYNAADIRIGGRAYADRVIVAGGGGSKASSGAVGGNGGGLTGGNGTSSEANRAAVGTGGTQNSGGTGGSSGTLGMGGNGIVYDDSTKGGAGGAGYYGGGAGNAVKWKDHFRNYYASAGGGGGSSYTHPDLCTNVKHTQGYREGKGYITISMVTE